jgi:DNA end-binding protein Ku
MARPIWTGAISFGLVNVPVKLFSAVRHKEVRFHMLHAKDGGRVKQKRFCSVEDKEIPYEDVIKGYELSAGKYVPIEPKELEKLDPKATRTIDIEDFVDLSDIDPIYFDATYYLVPDKGAAKPYALLMAAMQKTGKVGIARMVMRTKQYLCAVRPLGEALAISTMQYADEIVSTEDLDDLPSSSSQPKGKELEMAEQLVESLSGKFKPSKYKDEYREKVLELVQKKSEGEEIVAPEAEAAPAKVVSLMDALRKSLAAKDKPEREERGERRHVAQAARTARKKSPAKKTRARKKKSA